MIGKIYPSHFNYQDARTHKTSVKSRPVLILKMPEGFDTECTVLPVSTVSRKEFLNDEYDIPLKVKDYPKLSLKRDCYIRAHKQATVYKADVDFNKCIGDLKKHYNETYVETIKKLEKFNDKLVSGALQ